MKKILFIAFGVAGLVNLAAAQAKVSPTMTPLPTSAQVAKDTKTKSDAAAKMNAPAASTKDTKWVDPNTANYKKAGVTDGQIAEMNHSMQDLDKKKIAIQSNTQLTAEQKKNNLAAIETERQAIQRKTMGADTYKKYSELSQSKAKPVKDTKPATAN